MNTKVAKIISAVSLLLILVIGCTDNSTVSPYDEILKNPPFAGLTDSISQEPKNDLLYFKRAVLLNTNNLPEPALADFKKAWSLKKDEKYALGISTILVEKKPDSAILFLNQALQELPNSFLLQLSLARGYDARDKTDEALKICDDILQKNPQQVDVLKLKADLLDKKGNTAESIAILEKAYSLAPVDVELNYVLALKYAEAKNPKVLAICDSLIKADSGDVHAEPYYYKGIYYSNTGDKNKAYSLFDEAVRHDYYFMDGYIEKGSLLYDMKKYPEAIKVFALAITISPQFADAYYWTARCQEAMGQTDDALLNYQKAIGLDADFKEAKEAIERIKKEK